MGEVVRHFRTEPMTQPIRIPRSVACLRGGSMTALMGTVRGRTRTFVAAGSAAMFVVIAVVALFASQRSASNVRTAAALRAAHGVDLLVTIGVELPSLTPAAVAGELPPAAALRLDAAIKRGQIEGLLADLIIWDRTGRAVYSSVESAEGTRPPKDAQLIAALAGHSVSVVEGHEIDPISRKPTGVVESLEPLTDRRGMVYGAIEADISLKPIETAATQVQRSSALLIIGGGALVWLLLLPLWVRLARSQARDWVPGRRRTLRAFREALDAGTIELVYQPQVDPGSWRVAAVEALVRWRRDGALLTPDRFLPAVESSALMPRLTDRVLDLALTQLARWRCADIPVRVSVNLSATDLHDRTFPQRLATKLVLYGVMARDLTVEVTETAVFEDAEQARLVLGALDEMGVDIALDDFGTGHASISRLHGLGVFSEIKVDRSFVSETAQRSRAYLLAMVSFGLSLGLRVVAEGVEDSETMDILNALGCDLAQGYLISRPLESAAMTVWLTQDHGPQTSDQALVASHL
jgi:EAL domain-containing protein (putative c-di-GMP-specific phosphodiesterase class I)